MTCDEHSPQQGQGVWAFRGVPVALLAGEVMLIFWILFFLNFLHLMGISLVDSR
jgi:hypothetical protein